ncbi:histone h1.3 [Penicillium capsulatum]|uniref:Histone h1.3 n=1 Tax=Penicillium capsulatum TaxID=69766 RepID=A0A9W9HQG6_9EURO|nr:histone h1.3 [Penicillium capsulatum]KAJ6112573.1 histone h1.3 [Penicillium capsulatum]
MGKPKKIDNDPLEGLSSVDLRILVLSMVCTTEPVKLDWSKLADKGGYTVASARTTWNNARRKLTSQYDANGQDGTTTTAPTTPTSATKKARKTPASNKRKRGNKKGDNNDTTISETDATPLKFKSAPKDTAEAEDAATKDKSGGGEVKNESDDIQDEDESGAKAEEL